MYNFELKLVHVPFWVKPAARFWPIQFPTHEPFYDVVKV